MPPHRPQATDASNGTLRGVGKDHIRPFGALPSRRRAQARDTAVVGKGHILCSCPVPDDWGISAYVGVREPASAPSAPGSSQGGASGPNGPQFVDMGHPSSLPGPARAAIAQARRRVGRDAARKPAPQAPVLRNGLRVAALGRRRPGLVGRAPCPSCWDTGRWVHSPGRGGRRRRRGPGPATGQASVRGRRRIAASPAHRPSGP